jgi:hypothetical protein
LSIDVAVMAEGADPLAQADYYALRAYAGIAPVTRQSGKTKQIIMRLIAISDCATPSTTGLARAYRTMIEAKSIMPVYVASAMVTVAHSVVSPIVCWRC